MDDYFGSIEEGEISVFASYKLCNLLIIHFSLSFLWNCKYLHYYILGYNAFVK